MNKDRTVVTESLDDPDFLDGHNVPKQQIRKLLLEMRLNKYGKEYFLFNLFDICGTYFPSGLTSDLVAVVNKILKSNQKERLTEDEFTEYDQNNRNKRKPVPRKRRS